MTLDELYRTIQQRKGADTATSYTAKLYAKGTAHIAKKVGEEAVEVAMAATSQGKQEVIGESADLLFHLLVLWSALGVEPAEVMRALEARKGVSGIAEKANRKES